MHSVCAFALECVAFMRYGATVLVVSYLSTLGVSDHRDLNHVGILLIIDKSVLQCSYVHTSVPAM